MVLYGTVPPFQDPEIPIEYLGSSAGCSTDDDEDQYGYGDDDDGDGDDADGDGDADDAADTARGLRGVADGGFWVVFQPLKIRTRQGLGAWGWSYKYIFKWMFFQPN